MIRKLLRRKRSRGSVAVETALWIPFVFILFTGTVELGRITYTYYTLQKTLNSVARMVSTQPNINFCNPYDPTIQQIKMMAILSSSDANRSPSEQTNGLVANLTPEMIEVRAERYSRETGAITDCECVAAAGGCDASGGARGPDYVAVSIPDGYPMRLRIPGLTNEPIPLRPHVLVPYSGL